MHVCVLLYYRVLCMYVYVHVLKYAFIFLLRRRERLRSIVMSMSVCVSVCLFICPRGYRRNHHMRDLYHFWCMFAMSVAGPPPVC